jgi:hypothetical protein
MAASSTCDQGRAIPDKQQYSAVCGHGGLCKTRYVTRNWQRLQQDYKIGFVFLLMYTCVLAPHALPTCTCAHQSWATMGYMWSGRAVAIEVGQRRMGKE